MEKVLKLNKMGDYVMGDCFRVIILTILGVIGLYLAIILAADHLFFYFLGITACIYGLYRIKVPLTKESIDAERIGEKYLLTYSKKSGLLSITYGVFILITFSIYDVYDLYALIVMLIVTFFYFALIFYLSRKYRETNKDIPKKSRSTEGLIVLLLIYALFLISVAIFPNAIKGMVLFHNNINASNIIYEYRVDSDSRLETTFIIYLNNDKEIGFAKVEPRNANRLLPGLFRVYAYSLNRKCVIDIQTGRATILSRGSERHIDKNAKKDDIRIEYWYWYKTQEASSEVRQLNRGFAYMGIKHEFIEIEGIEYKFIEYFDGIFNGIYIYFFKNYEQLDRDFSF